MPIIIKNPSTPPPEPAQSPPEKKTPESSPEPVETPPEEEAPVVEETPPEPERTPEEDAELLAQKRATRNPKRTKYQIIRKDKTAKDYKALKLMVGGREQPMSDSSKFMLDMLVKDEKPT